MLGKEVMTSGWRGEIRKLSRSRRRCAWYLYGSCGSCRVGSSTCTNASNSKDGVSDDEDDESEDQLGENQVRKVEWLARLL